LNFTGGLVSDLSHGRFDSWVVAGDYRRYLRTSLRSAFAFRALGYYAGGDRPRPINIGGSWHCAATRSTGTSPAAAYGWSTASGVSRSPTSFPLVSPFGEVRFPGVQGRVLADLGRAWTAATVRSRHPRERRPRVADADWPARSCCGSIWAIGFHSGVVDGYALPAPTHGTRFVDFFFGFNYLNRQMACA